MAKVTILVSCPAFDDDAWFEDVGENLQAQSLTDWEAFFIAPQDNQKNAPWLAELAIRDPRFKSVETVQAGLDSAGGEYVLFSDPADVFLPTALENLCKLADESAADVVAGAIARLSRRRSAAALTPALAPVFRWQIAGFPNKISDLTPLHYPVFYGKGLFSFLSGKLFRTRFLQSVDAASFVSDVLAARVLCFLAQRVRLLPETVLGRVDAVHTDPTRDAYWTSYERARGHFAPSAASYNFFLQCSVYHLMYEVPLGEWMAFAQELAIRLQVWGGAPQEESFDSRTFADLCQFQLIGLMRLYERLLRERAATNAQLYDVKHFLSLLLKNSCVLPNPFPDK